MFRSRFGLVFGSFCSRFANRLSCQIKFFSGEVSFCRRAALINSLGVFRGVLQAFHFS